jgi:hypothetical protein
MRRRVQISRNIMEITGLFVIGLRELLSWFAHHSQRLARRCRVVSCSPTISRNIMENTGLFVVAQRRGAPRKGFSSLPLRDTLDVVSPDIEAANAALALDPDLLPPLGSYVRVTTPSGVYRGEVLRMERARGNDEVTWSWANGVVFSLRATPESAVLQLWRGSNYELKVLSLPLSQRDDMGGCFQPASWPRVHQLEQREPWGGS